MFKLNMVEQEEVAFYGEKVLVVNSTSSSVEFS